MIENTKGGRDYENGTGETPCTPPPPLSITEYTVLSGDVGFYCGLCRKIKSQALEKRAKYL